MKSMPNSHMRSVRFLIAFRLALFAVPAVFLLSFPSLAAQEYGAVAGKIEYQTFRYDPDDRMLGYGVHSYDDDFNRIETAYHDDAGRYESSAEYSYDSESRLVKEVFVDYGLSTPRYTRSYYYDAAGKKIRCVDYSGSGEKLGELVYRHDSSGRIIEERHVNPAGETSYRAEITVSEGGEKLRTEVFVPGEAGEVLESYAVYEYDGRSRLTKTSIFSADGKLEWYLVHKWKEIDEGVTAE